MKVLASALLLSLELLLCSTVWAQYGSKESFAKDASYSKDEFRAIYKILYERTKDSALIPNEDVLKNWNANLEKFNLTEEEALAMFSYTQRLYIVNQDLRQKTPKKESVIFASVLNSGIEKMPVYVGTVYRNIWPFPGWKERYSKGNTVTELAFTSTRAEKLDGPMTSPTEPIRFVIHSKNGRDISKFSQYSHEKEILFKTLSTFKVLDVRTAHDFEVMGRRDLMGTEIHMEEL